MTNEELLDQIKAGNDLMGQLYEQNRKLIYSIAKHFLARAEREDLEQEGYLALCKAVDSYTPGRESKFSTFFALVLWHHFSRYVSHCARVTMPEGMGREVRKMKKLQSIAQRDIGRKVTRNELMQIFGWGEVHTSNVIRSAEVARPVSMDAPVRTSVRDDDLTVADLLPASGDPIGELTDRLYEENLARKLWEVVGTLPDRKAATIVKTFKEGKTLATIAKEEGVSTECVRRHRDGGIRLLKKGDRYKRIREICDFDIYSAGLKRTGLSSFNYSWTSSTERAALEAMERSERAW